MLGLWLTDTINWREDDYCTGCRNVSHCQQQQCYSELRSPRRSYSTYLRNDSWVQTFHRGFSNARGGVVIRASKNETTGVVNGVVRWTKTESLVYAQVYTTVISLFSKYFLLLTLFEIILRCCDFGRFHSVDHFRIGIISGLWII